jgi:hypothetical protein
LVAVVLKILRVRPLAVNHVLAVVAVEGWHMVTISQLVLAKTSV